MKKLLILLFLITACAGSKIALQSDFQKMSENKTGTLLTVDLKTNGRIREGQQCYLNFEDGANKYELLLKEGMWDYALPFNQNEAEITKITCGPFYYYDLKNQGTRFSFSNEKIKYLGIINFELEDKGKMEWGLATKDKAKLEDRVQQMGLFNESVEIDILKL